MQIHCAYDKLVPVSELKTHPKNPNKHPPEQIDRLAKILEYQGWRYPIKVSKLSGLVTSGHGRIAAALVNKWPQVPVNYQDYDDEDQEYADIVSDNAIAEWAELDLGGINTEVGNLGPDFDLEMLGLQDFELEPADKYGDKDADATPEVRKTDILLGDMFAMGKHRLLCGDSTQRDQVQRLVGGEKVDMVFTSPPYNVGIKYESHKDDMSDSEYKKMMVSIIGNCFESMKGGRIIAWNVGVSPKSFPHHHGVWLENAGFSLFRHCTWKKPGVSIPTFTHSRNNPVSRNYLPNYVHEIFYLMSKGPVEKGAATEMPEELANDVWEIAPSSGFDTGHPAAFPSRLAALCITALTAQTESVLEPFCGSGSTLIACEKTGRACFGMEIDPQYCQVIVDRWEQFTGLKATKVEAEALPKSSGPRTRKKK